MSTNAAPAIETTGLTYSVAGREIVSNVSLSLMRGQSVALLGPNGSGKTTLLRLLTGIREATSGNVCIDGRPLREIPRAEMACFVSYLPQNTWTEFDITVADAVAMGRFAHIGWLRSPSATDHQSIKRAMEQVGVTSLAARRLPTLSAGERQRVFIARALAQGSPVLLLDEPTSALDIGHQLELVQILGRLHREGKTLFAAVHDLRLAWMHFDRAVLMDHGRITADGPVRDVVTSKAAADAFGVTVQVDDAHNMLHFERAGTEI